MSRTPLLTISGVLAFIVGTTGLWYGFATSFLVPGTLGERYFQSRVWPGNVSLLASLLALAAAGWLLRRSAPDSKITIVQAISYSIGGAAGLGVLFAVVGALINQR